MKTLTGAKTWHLALFWTFLVPSQGLLDGLLGSGGGSGGGLLGTGIGGTKGLLGTGLLASGSTGGDSGKGKDTDKGGLLGTAIGGEKGLLGTGLLASGGTGGDSGKDSDKGGLLGTGLLGGGSSGGGGLLGLGGGGGGGLLGVGSLLGNTTGALLGGDSEKGGLLGGVLGEKGLLGGEGLLGGVLGEKGLLGDEGVLGGVLGEKGLLGGEGLLGGVLGEKGLLGGEGLLGGVLGEKGLLGGEGLLGGILGKDGLLGGNLLGLGGLLGGGQSKEPFKWFNALSLEIVRGSWKVLPGPEIVLNLQSKVLANFPGLLKFLSGSSVEMNITSHLAITQTKPGDLRLELKNCKDLIGGFTIQLPKGLLSSLLNGVINIAFRTILPTLVCPLFQIWFGFINIQLHILNDFVFLGLLGKLHTALSSVPFSTGQFSELDFKDKPFPGAFLDWLLKFVGSIGSRTST
ncbi:uncharacterized protein LOC140706435 isoform X2 [Pogona vitticeps]